MTIGETVLIATLIVLIWQTVLLRREHRLGSIRTLYEKWGLISQLEVQHPGLNRMLMPKDTWEKLREWDDEKVRRRALALAIFDTFSMMYAASRGNRLPRWGRHIKKRARWLPDWVIELAVGSAQDLLLENEPYIRKVMGNPEMVEMWREGALGETWDGYAFKEYLDTIIAEEEARR